MMISYNECGGTATNATDSVATAKQNNHIAKRLRYIQYDLDAKDFITKKYGFYWYYVSMFVFNEIQSHINITNRNFSKNTKLLGFGQCCFSTKYIANNVNESKVRYEMEFGKKTDNVIINETRKALKILEECDLIQDKVGDVVTMNLKMANSTANERTYMETLLNDLGIDLSDGKTIKDAVIEYFQRKNETIIPTESKTIPIAEKNQIPKCDVTESNVKETAVAEEKQEQLTETKPTIPKCSVGEEELENQVAEKTSNATAISMDEIRSMHYKLYSQERRFNGNTQPINDSEIMYKREQELSEKVDINLAF